MGAAPSDVATLSPQRSPGRAAEERARAPGEASPAPPARPRLLRENRFRVVGRPVSQREAPGAGNAPFALIGPGRVLLAGAGQRGVGSTPRSGAGTASRKFPNRAGLAVTYRQRGLPRRGGPFLPSLRNPHWRLARRGAQIFLFLCNVTQVSSRWNIFLTRKILSPILAEVSIGQGSPTEKPWGVGGKESGFGKPKK